MKKIIITIIIALGLFSCIKEYETTTTFNIKNNSGHNVKISVYNGNFQIGVNLDSTFFILKNQPFSYSFTYKGENNNFPYPFGKISDSAYIIYDDTIYVKYVKVDTSTRNILNIDNYSGGRKNCSLFEYFYSITENDYNFAVENN
jgi:hypothetical protein